MFDLDTTAPVGVSRDDVPADPDARRALVIRLAEAHDGLTRAADFWTRYGDIAHYVADHRDEYLPKVPAGYVGRVGNSDDVTDRGLGIYLGFRGSASLVDSSVASSLTNNAELSSQRSYGIAGAAKRELERLTRAITAAFGEDWKPEFDKTLAQHRAEQPVDLPPGFTRR